MGGRLKGVKRYEAVGWESEQTQKCHDLGVAKSPLRLVVTDLTQTRQSDCEFFSRYVQLLLQVQGRQELYLTKDGFLPGRYDGEMGQGRIHSTEPCSPGWRS